MYAITTNCMYRRGHRGFNAILGTIVGLVVFHYTPSPFAFLLIVFTVISVASLPDIDGHFDSELDYFSSYSVLTSLPISHRGVTHTLLFAGIVGCLWGAVFVGLSQYLRPLLYIAPTVSLGVLAGGAAVLGILGHLLMDVLTLSPLRLFWPVSHQQYALGLCQADNHRINTGLQYLGQLVLIAGLLIVSWETWMRFEAARTNLSVVFPGGS